MTFGKLVSYAIITFAIGYMLWTLWQYFSTRKLGKQVTNPEFQELMRTGQLIDVRSGELYRRSHILGARHFPIEQLSTATNAFRKDKPILLYDSRGGAETVRAMKILKKAGYSDFYVLKEGFDYWDGKVKSS
ncbi:rhodanese-like domain-containing protein [Streptococcus caprae]|uniref:Rhodanese-like domain-containing protein n=1 Tax=Streptococcus caprae TaxID=1640501 RepID=A0ABV8CXC8_9STRE